MNFLHKMEQFGRMMNAGFFLDWGKKKGEQNILSLFLEKCLRVLLLKNSNFFEVTGVSNGSYVRDCSPDKYI